MTNPSRASWPGPDRRVSRRPPSEPSVPSTTLLLVDDQESNLHALEAILKDLEYTLVLARSGQEALYHLIRQEYAVILMDVRMPGMDGFETAELIHRRQKSRLTPIIFVTAMEET